MGSDYQADVQMLEAELARVEQAFRRLNESDWRRPTLLRPLEDTIATPEGVAMTAAIFDELIARRTVPGRPADLTDDLAWVRAASGRAPHADPRLPLIG